MESLDDGEDKIEVLPSTENDAAQDGDAQTPMEAEDSNILEEQWDAIRSVIHFLLEFREDDGHDPSRVFHKRVNKRNVPNYYEVIKEPMAFSNLKANLVARSWKDVQAFVRDCALIWHNAHTYNRPDAGAYQDASTMKRVMEEQFQALVSKQVFSAEDAQWPDLGEIPPVEDLPEDEDDEDEEEDEEDDEGDESDENRQRRGRRGRPSSSSAAAIKGALDGPKRRGRPPKVDTPMEGRVKNVLKGLRKLKDDEGVPIIYQFEKLPDKSAMPDYYEEITNPVSIETIKRSLKRKRYSSVDDFMKDVELMFNNAQQFNKDESQIFKDSVALQLEARKLASIEKSKPDTDFVAGEGRKPRPEGIQYKGETWAVGDWVHIRNANDISKPIVAQIYRTWEDADGQEWINACWYYRPEQTVHHFEKHFWPHEVLKTGQYRDHHVEELVDRCFVMFYTRFTRGRPKGLPSNREVYVCEARYNNNNKINKIKTWASCLPDETRDKDYEMDLFDNLASRKIKKQPSPLLGIFKDNLPDASDPPEPRWGAENAPPIIGGLYKGSRDENQSPPPEPTPEPIQPPQMPARQITRTPSQETQTYRQTTEGKANMDSANRNSAPGLSTGQHPNGPGTPFPHVNAQRGPQVPSPGYNQSLPGPQQHRSLSTGLTSSQQTPDSYASQQNQGRYGMNAARANATPRMEGAYVLPPAANDAIPLEIRKDFMVDENGHLIFFTQPPHLTITADGRPVRESVRERAAKLRQQRAAQKEREEKEAKKLEKQKEVATELLVRKRKLEDESAVPATDQPNKKQEADERKIIAKAVEVFKEFDRQTDLLWKRDWGDRWKEVKNYSLEKTIKGMNETIAREKREAAKQKTREQEWWDTYQMFNGKKVYKDDYDPMRRLG